MQGGIALGMGQDSRAASSGTTPGRGPARAPQGLSSLAQLASGVSSRSPQQPLEVLDDRVQGALLMIG